LDAVRPHPFPGFRDAAAATLTRVGAAEVVVVLAGAAVAALGTIGADARWLAALGGAVAEHGAPLNAVPFAGAPSAGWPNAPVLAELILHWLTVGFGDRGLLCAQVLAVVGGLAFLAADMGRRQASQAACAVALVLVALGAAPSLVVIRVQLFSLVLFPALVLLLRSEARLPSRRVWLVPLVLGVWSNLHGAVLVGFAVTAVYLVFSRVRQGPLEAAAVLVASTVAVCATPALARTPVYYLGVLHNEAARRGEGLWAPLSPHAGFDVLLIATGAVLVALALSARPALWELVALGCLAVVTVRTERSGVWLLFFAAPLAARSLRINFRLRAPLPALLVSAFSTAAAAAIAIGTHWPDASPPLIAQTLRQAHGTPVLADARLAEQIALDGGHVWMSNPLDAFPRRDQQLYLDWLDGRPAGRAAFAHAPRAVLVRRDGPAARLAATMPAFRVAAEDRFAVLYVRIKPA
jgi:hypothetical protein